MKRIAYVFGFFLCIATLQSFASVSPSSAHQYSLQGLTADDISLRIDLGKMDGSPADRTRVTNAVMQGVSSLPDSHELTCSLTVTGEVNIAVAKFTISVTVSGPCSEIKAHGKEVANQVLQDCKDYILHH